jgi:hypothetical protein
VITLKKVVDLKVSARIYALFQKKIAERKKKIVREKNAILDKGKVLKNISGSTHGCLYAF